MRSTVSHFLFFVILPVAVAAGLGFYALTIEEAHRKTLVIRELERDLSETVRALDTRIHVSDRLSGFGRQVFRLASAPHRLVRLQKAAERAWGFAFDLYLFDAHGQLVTPREIPLRSRFLGQKLWDKAILKIRDDPAKPAFNLRTALGASFDLEFFQEGIPLMPVSSRGSDGMLYWQERHPGKDASGLVLIAWRLPAATEILDVLARKTPRRPVALVTIDPTGTARSCWNTVASATLTEFAARSRQEKSHTFEFLDRIWVKAATPELTVYAGGEATRFRLDRWRAAISLASGLFLLALSLAWFRLPVLAPGVFISIRYKLVGLFVFAVLVPLMGISFLGFRSLKNLREVRIGEVFQEAKDLLYSLDAQFLQEVDRHRRFCEAIRDDPDMHRDPPGFREKIRKLQVVDTLDIMEMRDITGRVIFTTRNPQSTQALGKVAAALAVTCMENAPRLQDRLAPHREALGRQVDPLARMALESPELGLRHIAERPGVPHKLQFGSHKVFWYWDVYDDPRLEPAFIYIHKKVKNVIADFLRQHFRKGRLRRIGRFTLLVRWGSVEKWYPEGFRSPGRFRRFLDRVRLSGQPFLSGLRWGGRPCFAVGVPGIHLEDHQLLALYPEAAVDREIQREGRWILLGMSLALLLAAGSGWLFSKTLLVPIADVTQGISLIHARELTHRLPIRSEDEFGSLARLMNDVIEGLDDLAVARVIQEQLFPPAELTVGEYEIFGLSRAMVDVGGDYFDYRGNPERGIWGIVGDVSGHGVSAALVMGMAKCFFSNPELAGQPLAAQLVRFNHFLLDTIKKAKMMSLQVFAVDPVRHVMEFANAGHCFPFFWKAATGRIEELEMPSLPIGRLGRASYKSLEVALAPGDCLLFYSDGMFEALNPEGRFFGETQQAIDFAQVAASLDSPRDIVAAMFERLHAFTGGAPANDDVTIICMKRRVNSPPQDRSTSTPGAAT